MPMQDVKKTDMKSETNVKRVRRRNRWLPLYIAVVLVLTAGVGVALSTTVFFNVENIVVRNATIRKVAIGTPIIGRNIYQGHHLSIS